MVPAHVCPAWDFMQPEFFSPQGCELGQENEYIRLVGWRSESAERIHLSG
jgi:hypothetical protein